MYKIKLQKDLFLILNLEVSFGNYTTSFSFHLFSIQTYELWVARFFTNIFLIAFIFSNNNNNNTLFHKQIQHKGLHRYTNYTVYVVSVPCNGKTII